MMVIRNKKPAKHKRGVAGKKRKTRKIELPYTGDHGTGTAAAMAGTMIEPITHDGKADPNRRARRRRIEVIDGLTFLSLRQWQALREIRDAYSQVQKLSSGSPLKEQVDASPRPDQATAAQVDAMTRLKRAMDAVPRHHRAAVEWVCWENEPITTFVQGYQVARSDLQGAATAVADHLRY